MPLTLLGIIYIYIYLERPLSHKLPIWYYGWRFLSLEHVLFAQKENRNIVLNIALQNLYSRVYNWAQILPSACSFKDLSALHCALGSSGGLVRPSNEDQLVVVKANVASSPRNSFTLYAVLDGMGGMKEGADCARMALSGFVAALIFSAEFNLEDRIRSALETANQMVFERFRGKGGTTISAIITSQMNEAVAFNVGDSRIYEFSPKRSIKQISIDDTLGGALAQLGSGRPSDNSNQLIQFLGMGGGLLEPHIMPLSPFAEDKGYILATDGAYHLPVEVFEAIVHHAGSSNEIVQRLIKSSEWVGGLDNATVICLGPGGLKNSATLSDQQVSSIKLYGVQDGLEIQGQMSQKQDQYEERLPLVSRSALPLENEEAPKKESATFEKKRKSSTSKRKKIGKRSRAQKSEQSQIEIKLVDE